VEVGSFIELPIDMEGGLEEEKQKKKKVEVYLVIMALNLGN
jgi:hypothetical protein